MSQEHVFHVGRSVQDMTEEALIEHARASVSMEAWTVGECAMHWTKRYSRGRTDLDFGQIVGMTREQIWVRRHVFEKFGGHGCRDRLRFSHYVVALNWDDADECLEWAADSEATVAEMRAWRRASRGEDLFTDNLSPGEFEIIAGDIASITGVPDSITSTMAIVNSAGESQYAPFSDGEKKAEAKKKKDESESTGEKKPEKKAEKKPGDGKQKGSAGKPPKASKGSQPPPDDPDKISAAVDTMLKNYSTETQQQSVQKLLGRLLRRLESMESLMPAVHANPDAVCDIVGDVVHWSVGQIRACKWPESDRAIAKRISEVFREASVAAAELASGGDVQPALFDAGPREPGKVKLTSVLREWNEAFETNCIPTNARQAALLTRSRDSFFVANWKEAIERCRASPFCCGQNSTGWVANIDWFLKADTVVRLMEGNHDGFEETSHSAAVNREQENAAAIATVLGRADS